MSTAEFDTMLAADPAFGEICDARRDAWIAAMESESVRELAPTPAEAQSAAEVAA